MARAGTLPNCSSTANRRSAAGPIATAPSPDTSSAPSRSFHSSQTARLWRANATRRGSSWACRKSRARRRTGRCRGGRARTPARTHPAPSAHTRWTGRRCRRRPRRCRHCRSRPVWNHPSLGCPHVPKHPHLHNFEPPATEEEIRASSSSTSARSAATASRRRRTRRVDRAVEAVAATTRELLDSLVTNAPPKDREAEVAKARRAEQR